MSAKFHPDNLDTGINNRLDFVILKEEDGTLTISSRWCDGYHWKNCADVKVECGDIIVIKETTILCNLNRPLLVETANIAFGKSMMNTIDFAFPYFGTEK